MISKVLDCIEKARPGFPLPDQDRLILPRGYLVGWVDASELGEDQPGYEPVGADGLHSLWKPGALTYIEQVWSVEEARLIAQEIETVWLAELAEWLKNTAKEDETLVCNIEAARQAVRIL